MTRLTHEDDAGRARMVDVGDKPATRREAVAEARVRFGEVAYDALVRNRLAKGDAPAIARLAGIQAAKRTADWIPLCHAIPLDRVAIDLRFDETDRTVTVTGSAAASWTTGVEMEALVAVSAASLALYDMAKGLDRGIVIEQVRLLRKSGGKSGTWAAEAPGEANSSS